MNKVVKPINGITGEIVVPADKSISHRAIIVGSISQGVTTVSNFLKSDDCAATLQAFRSMGVEITEDGDDIKIAGKGLCGLKKPEKNIYLGNSGTSMRIIPGAVVGQNFEVVLEGDASLSKRPMGRIIKPLKKMGASIASINNNDKPPLKIKGSKIKSTHVKTDVASAQVKSCILLAGLYADGETSVQEPFKSRDHTERMLSYFGADIVTKDKVFIKGKSALKGKHVIVPGDISSAAFFIVLCLISPDSKLIIRSVGINPTRTGIIDVLKRMGAHIKVDNVKNDYEPTCDITARSSQLKATQVTPQEIPSLIDEIPILCVAASKAEGTTTISGIGELRIKETDRVSSMVENLSSLGQKISDQGDKIVITGNREQFYSGRKNKTLLNSYKDHRTAMSMAVASCCCKHECTISDAEFIDTSFPDFFKILEKVSRRG